MIIEFSAPGHIIFGLIKKYLMSSLFKDRSRIQYREEEVKLCKESA
jgi:hypothetical protein